MSKQEEDSKRTEPQSGPRSGSRISHSESFVYPVRSLLSHLQPGADVSQSGATSSSSTPRHPPPENVTISIPNPASDTRSAGRDASVHPPAIKRAISVPVNTSITSPQASGPLASQISAELLATNPSLGTRKSTAKILTQLPDISNFAALLGSTEKISFPKSPSPAQNLVEACATGPSGPRLATNERQLPYNLSQYGLVHLGPSSASSSADGSSEPRSAARSIACSIGGLSAPSTFSADPLIRATSSTGQRSELSAEGSSAAGSRSLSAASVPASPDTGTSGFPAEISLMDVPLYPSTQESSSVAASEAQLSSNESDPDHFITFRYEHKETEEGHYVVAGRKGQLTRCEDEPIRTPGAVQAFGVLIVVEEDERNDVLVVRQVSENAEELLGLSPKYLFSLECFTDTFPDSQANIIWDNIHFLNEHDPHSDDIEDSPHVFLLSGWSEPTNVTTESVEAGEDRRSWTCWCAVHRARPATDSSASDPGLIIFEFELERDAFNPLYPQVAADDSPRVLSPASSFFGSHSTPSAASETTLVGDELEAPRNGNDVFVTIASEESRLSSPDQSSLQSPSAGHAGLEPEGVEEWVPSVEDILESTTTRSKPLLALERLRRMTSPARGIDSPATLPSQPSSRRARRHIFHGGGPGGMGMMDMFTVMAQINEQLGAASDLDTFLKIVVGVVKDVTQFHRVLAYQFDEEWNGQVVAELMDWSQTRDLYKGLHFPASDIPPQARELYAINKVRLLYDRSKKTARIVCRSREDLDRPLNMTHCFLRAMSPIHVKYLENMGVRASMSISIVAFGSLWGLVTCHSYGQHGMRISFPVRQMLRLLSQSISRNIERLSYAQRLHTRKLINTVSSEAHPTGYIVSNADDLLGLFDADYGILVVGEGAKLLGPNFPGQEILVVAEYLRLKQFDAMQVSEAVTKDFVDLNLSTGLEVIAGLLYVPLSRAGKDFIAFFRKGQPQHVRWAGKPYKDENENQSRLEPRKSFKIWSETVAGRCRAWTDEQLETAGVLSLVYGKFIEVWREKENALHASKLTELLLSNASHEVRTPLNHIINYLEMAMNGQLDVETRENLQRSHAASKSLLFTINDLLDLTRLESGNETFFCESFDLHAAISDATNLYKNEAHRRHIDFELKFEDSPRIVIGDSQKIKTVVSNLTANALKYTSEGRVSVQCRTFPEPHGLRQPDQIAVEIVVSDTGCGIPRVTLESIFREFEQVESTGPKETNNGVGLGLAVVARIVEQLGGQLRVDSKVDQGSCFSFLIPLALRSTVSSPTSSRSHGSRATSLSAGHRSGAELDGLVEAFGASPSSAEHVQIEGSVRSTPGSFEVTGSKHPVRAVKVDGFEIDSRYASQHSVWTASVSPRSALAASEDSSPPKLRVLVVEDNDINRIILGKRLMLDGHTVSNATNGREGLDIVISGGQFDCVLMDIQMPIMNGFESTEGIRAYEQSQRNSSAASPASPSSIASFGSSSFSPSPLGASRLSHTRNGRHLIFAVSASLPESQRDELLRHGMDGWILKPIDFKRLREILKGVTDAKQRRKDYYRPGYNWEAGGWLTQPVDESGSGCLQKND